MKKLPIEEGLESLKQLGFLFNKEALDYFEINAPILDHVEMLLHTVGENGLKLTQKGKLPTKVVKEISLHKPRLSDQWYLEHTKRFLEDEQVSVQRARNVCEVGKLLRIVKKKIVLGSMAKAYLNASQADKYLYLLIVYKNVNLAYFDRAKEDPLTCNISFALMQTIRDKSEMYREHEVYMELMYNNYPTMPEAVERSIEPEGYFHKNSYEEFSFLVKLRLISNMLLPFALIEERGKWVDKNYAYQKSALLDVMLLPMDAIADKALLNKKQISTYLSRAKEIDIQADDLFHDFTFIYMQCMSVESFSESDIAKEIVNSKRLLGILSEKQELFYRDFAFSVKETFRYFTQLEVKGGGEKDMKGNFKSFIDGLYMLVADNTPFSIFKSIVSSIVFFAEVLQKTFGVDVKSLTFTQDCIERFEENVTNDIGAYLFLVNELEKRAKKVKRVNRQFEELTKEALVSMALAGMSIYTYERDGYI